MFDIAALAAEAEAAVRVVLLPIDIVALVNTTLTGLAALFSAFAAGYSIMSSIRSKRAEAGTQEVRTRVGEINENVAKLELNTNSIATRNEEIARKLGIVEGEHRQRAIGAETARVRAEAELVGMHRERDSSASRAPAPLVAPSDSTPVPVEDEAAAQIQRDIAKSTAESAKATNAINKRVAVATEKAADAQKQIADATKKKS